MQAIQVFTILQLTRSSLMFDASHRTSRSRRRSKSRAANLKSQSRRIRICTVQHRRLVDAGTNATVRSSRCACLESFFTEHACIRAVFVSVTWHVTRFLPQVGTAGNMDEAPSAVEADVAMEADPGVVKDTW